MKSRLFFPTGILGLLFLTAAISAQMKDVRSSEAKSAAATLMKERAKLIKSGKYHCCLKHPCTQCLVTMGACPCGKNATASKPVCHECKGGWAAGDGMMRGVNANTIKVMPRRMPGPTHVHSH